MSCTCNSTSLKCYYYYSELLRHLTYKGHDKSEVSPNLVRMIQYFNRVRGRGRRKKEETFLTFFLDVNVLDVGSC